MDRFVIVNGKKYKYKDVKELEEKNKKLEDRNIELRIQVQELEEKLKVARRELTVIKDLAEEALEKIRE